jgi:hypothetical protein
MKYFKFFVFFVFFLSFLGEVHSLTIEKPLSGSFVRGIIEIKWTGGTSPYTIKFFQPADGAQVDTVITSSTSYFYDTTRLMNGGTKIRVEGGAEFDERVFTIDNTEPNSDIQIIGIATKGRTINYGGTWSDISGISTIYKTTLCADTDAETKNGYVEIVDLTAPDTPLAQGTTSGTFTGSFTINDVIWNAIKNYSYIFVRIKLKDNAVDQNGENNEAVDFSNLLPIRKIKISGYIRDYKGNPVKDAKVIIGGEISQLTYTDTDGYFEFSGLVPYPYSSGYYYLIPAISNPFPSIREYNEIDTDLVNQNFIIMNGWTNRNYDRGNTNDYYFKITTSLPSNSRLVKEWTISLGENTLTGDIDWDGKLDLLINDPYHLNVYYYDLATKQYELKFSKLTNYNLYLVDSIDRDTAIEVLMVGKGKNLCEIYDNQLNKLRTKSLTAPPEDTKWGLKFPGKQVLLAGDGTNYETIILYDPLTDKIIWETEISQKIIPENLNIYVRDDAKVMAIFGKESDTDDIVLLAIDVFTGNPLWTKKLVGVRGRLKIYVSDVDIIGVRTSTENSSFPLTVYTFNPENGSILLQVPIGVYTVDANVCVSDIDNDGIKEVIISDTNGNIYIVDIINGWVKNVKYNVGKVWATVDFDGKSDYNKEIIVSKGSYIKVLDSSLNELMSYDLKDTIVRVIVSDVNNDGRIEIIASSLTTTYILKPSSTVEYPNSPIKLTGFIGAGGVYISWVYISNGAPLSGFKIYRSVDGFTWGEPIATTTADKRFYKDIPELGTWYYKVSAYNDYGEVDASSVVVNGEESAGSSIIISFPGAFPPESKGCFIASVCFGENSWQVKILKEFRDRFLLKNNIGRSFVRFYYEHSPKISEFLRENRIFKVIVKVSLYPIVFVVYLIINGNGILPFLLLIFVFIIFSLFYRKFLLKKVS